MEVSANPGSDQSLVQLLKLRWQLRMARWVHRRIPPARKIELNHRNIFIIPNKQGMGFLFVISLMFLGAVNYEISLAFALVFLLLGVFVLSIFYTFRNLSGLHLTAIPGGSVFAGEKAEVTIVLNRHGDRMYENLQLGFSDSRRQIANLIDQQEQRLSLYVTTRKRGRFNPGRLRIETIFPFGICTAWSLLDLNFHCLVYPLPIECDLDWLVNQQENQGNTSITRGNDDYYGLRVYQRGDSLKHVAWKNLARGQGMLTKEYSSNMDDKIWLRWDMFPDQDTESRLSRLCWCVLTLDSAGLDYGLEMPGVKISPAKGAEHFTAMLETLAIYGLTGEH